ncbi:MAG: phage holin family protein [Tissierella sp.]|uniref:phage holin family protein n=1 Tax=Tissierella sp. TaxID=41274 RepID=UPI003F9446E5
MNHILIKIETVFENDYLYVLLIFLIFDIITGTLKSFINNSVYSKINKKGITTHIAIFLFTTFFSWVFSIFNANEYSNIIIMFYIASYGLSIIENIGQMGLPIPKWLSGKFKVLQDEMNEEVKNETERTE